MLIFCYFGFIACQRVDQYLNAPEAELSKSYFNGFSIRAPTIKIVLQAAPLKNRFSKVLENIRSGTTRFCPCVQLLLFHSVIATLYFQLPSPHFQQCFLMYIGVTY